MTAPDYFIPDRAPHAFYPLRAFLRAPPLGVAAEYIAALTAPGDLVIDPFGATPNVARAALALERRAIVVESNPLWAWLARALATLPPAAEIDAALARLGDTPKDDLPLRAHVNQLYATICAACNQATPADYFVRTREGGIVSRHYTCAHCGATRDDPATEDDLKRADALAARGLHYHFAFERVAPEGGLHADRIRKMLDLYTPRNLYALATITQKIEARFHATRERDLLLLLLLHLLERGAAFYAAPDAAPQLTRHKAFVEFNLWREIELAARALASPNVILSYALSAVEGEAKNLADENETLRSAQGDPVLDLAESPRDVANAAARVFIGRGDAKTLARDLPRDSTALILTAPPTRRVAVWALSYFWGAWILGRAAAQSLAPFLDTRKDAAWEWRWYADALNSSLKSIARMLRADARAVFVFSEAWHPVIEALLLAAAGARLQLESFLFQPRLGDLPRREFDDVRASYRIAFGKTADDGRPTTDAAALEKQIRASALAAANEIFVRRGEALAFSWVHHAAFARVARQGLLAAALSVKMKIAPGRFIHNAVIAGLQDGYAHDLDHYESKEQFLWLRRSGELAAPLIDRVEDAGREFVVRALARPIPREELEDALYRQFPGELTPEAGLIELCAAAYAEPIAEAERARAVDVLARLGARLGYHVIASPEGAKQSPSRELGIASSHASRPLLAMTDWDVVWQSGGEIAHAFVWRARAQFADLASLHIAPARGYIVVPEKLVALMREKTRRLPHLADAFHEAGWNFVRVPFVEKLLAQEKVERSDIALMVGLVPPIGEEKAQLELL